MVKRRLILIIALCLVATPALAIDIQNWNTAIGGNNMFTMYQSDTLDPWQVTFGAVFNVAGDPMIFTLPNDEELLVVEQMIGNQFYAAIGIMGYVDIGIAGSYNYVTGDDMDEAGEKNMVSPVFPTDTDLSYLGMGDVRVMLKGRILENKPNRVGIALVPFVSFPTGDKDYYMGAGAVDGGALLVLDKRFDRFNIVLNGGYKYKGVSEGEDGEDIIPKDEFHFGLGVNVWVATWCDIMAEVIGKTLDYDLDTLDSELPVEMMAGARFFSGHAMSFIVGGGAGVTSGIGNPAYRGFAGFDVTYPLVDRERPGQEKTGPVIDPKSKTIDSDFDGLMNYDETTIWHTDYMNPDSDGDGLKDGEETQKYKTDPKKADTDGDALNDGEEVKLYGTNPRMTDSDGDTLPDGVEAQQLRTNPALADTDADKIPDNVDGEPLQAETINGYQDEDGVPEVTLAKRPTGVIMFENVIWLPTKINWTGKKNNKIAPESKPMLDDVAVMLTEYPNIKVQIEEHSARGGDENLNVRMTSLHADEIRAYLIKKGISEDRITAVGHGSSFPIASNATPEGRAKNARTELIIVEK